MVHLFSNSTSGTLIENSYLFEYWGLKEGYSIANIRNKHDRFLVLFLIILHWSEFKVKLVKCKTKISIYAVTLLNKDRISNSYTYNVPILIIFLVLTDILI